MSTKYNLLRQKRRVWIEHGQKKVINKWSDAAITVNRNDACDLRCNKMIQRDGKAEMANHDYGKAEMENHDFGWAIHKLKSGDRVFREGWNGDGQVLELQVPTEYSKMTLPYIFIKTVQGDFVPWMASQTDMLQNDWRKVE